MHHIGWIYFYQRGRGACLFMLLNNMFLIYWWRRIKTMKIKQSHNTQHTHHNSLEHKDVCWPIQNSCIRSSMTIYLSIYQIIYDYLSIHISIYSAFHWLMQMLNLNWKLKKGVKKITLYSFCNIVFFFSENYPFNHISYIY